MSVGTEILAVSEIVDTAARSLGQMFASWDPGIDPESIEEVVRAELWYATADLGHLFSPEAVAERDALSAHIDDALAEALRRHLAGEL